MLYIYIYIYILYLIHLVNNRFQNFKEAFPEEAGIFQISQSLPNREKGPMLTGRAERGITQKSQEPGPGDYSVDIINKRIQHTFSRTHKAQDLKDRSGSTTGEVSYLPILDIGGIGHSFSKCTNIDSGVSKFALSVPGPGYYILPRKNKVTDEAVPAYSFGMGGQEVSFPKRTNQLELNVKVGEQSLGNYQKFMEGKRWKLSHGEKMRLYDYLVQRKKKRGSLGELIMERNTQSLERHSPAVQNRILEKRLVVNTVRHKCVKKARESLNEKFIALLRDKLEKKQRRVQINTDKNVYILYI